MMRKPISAEQREREKQTELARLERNRKEREYKERLAEITRKNELRIEALKTKREQEPSPPRIKLPKRKDLRKRWEAAEALKKK